MSWQAQVRRLSSVFAALALAMTTGLSAYAAHGAEGADQARLYSAAIMLAVHGLGLLSLARYRPELLFSLVRLGVMLGALLFCGSLVAAVFLQFRPWLAPAGGSMLMLSWLLAGLALWRGQASKERGDGDQD